MDQAKIAGPDTRSAHGVGARPAGWLKFQCGPREKAYYLVALSRTLLRSEPVKSEELVEILEQELKDVVCVTMAECIRRCETTAANYKKLATRLDFMSSASQIRASEAAAEALADIADELRAELMLLKGGDRA